MSWRCCADWLLRLAALAVSRGTPNVPASWRQTALRTAVVSQRKAPAWTFVRAGGSVRRWRSGPQFVSGGHARGALPRTLARAMLEVRMSTGCCRCATIGTRASESLLCETFSVVRRPASALRAQLLGGWSHEVPLTLLALDHRRGAGLRRHQCLCRKCGSSAGERS